MEEKKVDLTYNIKYAVDRQNPMQSHVVVWINDTEDSFEFHVDKISHASGVSAVHGTPVDYFRNSIYQYICAKENLL